MEKPWFDINPNITNDKWWLYSSVVDCEKNEQCEHDENKVVGYLILQDCVGPHQRLVYRLSIWYKDDPNRYQRTIYDLDWLQCGEHLASLNKNDIITTTSGNVFRVHECLFSSFSQLDFCKILEKVDL